MRDSIIAGALFTAAILTGTSVLAANAKGPYTFALITKTNENPVFVLEKDEGIAKAKQLGVKLLTFTGKYDGDNASQVTAIENSISAGVNAIIIVPNDTKAIVSQIQEARKAVSSSSITIHRWSRSMQPMPPSRPTISRLEN